MHLTGGRVATRVHAWALAFLVVTSYTANKLLAGFYNGDFPENRQIAKLRTSPKFPALRYIAENAQETWSGMSQKQSEYENSRTSWNSMLVSCVINLYHCAIALHTHYVLPSCTLCPCYIYSSSITAPRKGKYMCNHGQFCWVYYNSYKLRAQWCREWFYKSMGHKTWF